MGHIEYRDTENPDIIVRVWVEAEPHWADWLWVPLLVIGLVVLVCGRP